MEKWTESLDKYLEEGKLPLVGEIFSRKKEIGDKLKLQREESHKIALSRRRKQGAGEKFLFLMGEWQRQLSFFWDRRLLPGRRKGGD